MDITVYDQREKQVEEQQCDGIAGIPAHTVSENLRCRLRKKAANV